MNNEHLTEALRRLRKSSSDDNVDRYVLADGFMKGCAEAEMWSSRLVTNILLSFLTTHRADSKRFEMLSILSTILSWDDLEREKAGLQRVGNRGNGVKSPVSVEKGKKKDRRGERSAEEEAAMNEVCLTLCDLSGGRSG